MHGSVRYLPSIMLTWAPELESLELPQESAADCSACPMAGAPFLPDIKCCTYHPMLPNFLVGRALAREDAGSEAIRRRLENPEGIDARGIHAPSAWLTGYERHREQSFGRDRRWACPYWVPGELNCSIWKDRGSVCRTWHCKHGSGVRGHRLWMAVRNLIGHLQQLLMQSVVCHVAVDEDWERFYLAAAEHVRTLDHDAIEDELLNTLRDAVRDRHSALHAELPPVLAPLVRNLTERGEQVIIEGYSPWQTERFSKSVYSLLAAMDGKRSWPEALAIANQTDPRIDESWVRRLFDIDALHAPQEGKEWGFESDDLDVL